MLSQAEASLRVEELIDLLAAGKKPGEGTLVEYKAGWPDVAKFAVQLASLGNAGRGEPAFLLVGIDDVTQKIVGAPSTDLQQFRTKLEARFDRHVAPKLSRSGHTSRGSDVVQWVVFDTSDPPYVVRPADPGKADRWLVPVRRGTDKEDANRQDLLALLVPRQRAARFELVEVEVRPGADYFGAPIKLRVMFRVFCSHPDNAPVVLSVYKLSGTVTVDSVEYPLRDIEISTEDKAHFVQLGTHHAVVNGNGTFLLMGSPQLAAQGLTFESVSARLRLEPESHPFAVSLERTLTTKTEDGPAGGRVSTARWFLIPPHQ